MAKIRFTINLNVTGGGDSSFQVILVNETNEAIGLKGRPASRIEIRLPGKFTRKELGQVEVKHLSQEGWSPGLNSSGNAHVISWKGAGGRWMPGQAISFHLSNLPVRVSEMTGDVQVFFHNLAGDEIPESLSQALHPAEEIKNSLADMLVREAVKGAVELAGPSSESGGLELHISNPSARNKAAIVLPGHDQTINFSIINRSGKAIPLQPGATTLEIHFPEFFINQEVKSFVVFCYNAEHWQQASSGDFRTVLLKWTGETGTLSPEGWITFAIGNFSCVASGMSGTCGVELKSAAGSFSGGHSIHVAGQPGRVSFRDTGVHLHRNKNKSKRFNLNSIFMDNQNTVDMVLANSQAPDNAAIVYTGVTAELAVGFTNSTGGLITMSEASGSNIALYLPYYFTPAEISAITVTNMSQPGWTAENQGGVITLVWKGADGSWENGASLTFNLSNVKTDSQPGTDTLQAGFNNLSGNNIPSQLGVQLALLTPDKKGNKKLKEVLEVSALNGGMVYVSPAGSPLSNTIYLNFKNFTDKALFTGKEHWKGNPRVLVSFVYGTTSGAIAPDDKSGAGSVGSAWSISGGVYVNQTGDWSVDNPVPTSSADSPAWTLSPAQGNPVIIGSGANSNVTFSFGSVVSFTPVGATQMYVQFIDFYADDDTKYDDTVFVVPLQKLVQPASGVTGIWCSVDKIQVTEKNQQISVPLTWGMLGVGSVKISFYLPGVKIDDIKIQYKNSHPVLDYGNANVEFHGLTETQVLLFTIAGYRDTDYTLLLNKTSGQVPLIFPPKINSFTIQAKETAPPHSFTFQLDWDIQGQNRFEISEDDGSGSPKVLPVPANANNYLVHPQAPSTTYTLTLFGNNSQV